MTAPELSLQRGIAGMRAPVPLWVIQTADQNAHEWPLMAERPIFTEHVRDQFGWMVESYMLRREMQARYPASSGMVLCDELLRRCSG
jgi:hypothetical protein